jgi:hypothetical protein
MLWQSQDMPEALGPWDLQASAAQWNAPPEKIKAD